MGQVPYDEEDDDEDDDVSAADKTKILREIDFQALYSWLSCTAEYVLFVYQMMMKSTQQRLRPDRSCSPCAVVLFA